MVFSSRSPRFVHPFISRQNPILCLLEASTCNTLSKIKQSQGLLLTSGLFLHPFPPSKLLQLLLCLPTTPPILSYAQLLLHHSPSPPLFSYNSLIKAHSNSLSFLLFRSLLRDASALPPNQYTLTFVLSSCRPGTGLELIEAEQVRAHAVRRGFQSNVFLSNALIQMYGTWGLVACAEKLFNECSQRDLFSWNLMLGVYAGCGDAECAQKLFDEMPDRDVVSWSTVIAGHVQTGRFLEGMNLFRQMQLSGVAPNEFTLSAILSACANLLALDQGKWIHAFMINKGKISIMNDRVLASLIDMYAKCGEMVLASALFHSRKEKTVRVWNAFLSGLAVHGESEEAARVFERMDVAPDKVTFAALLSACSRGGLVEKGRLYFGLMRTAYGIEPEAEHYGCMVDLLGRAGLLGEAEAMAASMPGSADAAAWGALLGACRIYGDSERGRRVIKVLEPCEHAGCHVLLANVYSGSGMWQEAGEVRDGVGMARGRRLPGCSSVEVDGVFQQFLAGNR